MQYAIDMFAEKVADYRPDHIAPAIESRGFHLWYAPGLQIGHWLCASFVNPVNLPAAIHTASYALEYGNDTLELHQDAFPKGSRVLIVDDLIATGGTAAATAELVQKAGSEVIGYGFLIELVGLEGRSKLPNVPITTLLEY